MTDRQYPIYQESEELHISAFGVEWNGENARWGPCRRPKGIIHYVLSGSGYINGHKVSENQGFYIAPSSFSEYFPDQDDPWNYFWIDASAEFAQRYIQPAVQPDENGIFEYNFKGKLLTVIDKIMAVNRPMGTIESLAFAFSILKLHTPPADVSGARQYVLQAKNYIESSINKHITVYDVADAISINDRYLYTLFVRYEGISPKEYILRRKIETARDLLENTGLSIMEVSAASGFPDIYSFSRTFKGKTGTSPTEFRKTISG